MTNSNALIELELLAARYGPDFISSAVGANRRLMMDWYDDPDYCTHRDAWHQGNYCRICLIDKFRDKFFGVASTEILDEKNMWLLLLNDVWGLHVARFPEGRDYSNLAPLYEPKQVRIAKKQHRNYHPIEIETVQQLGFSGFGFPKIVKSVYPPLYQYRLIGLYYEKVKGLIVALHLIEQDARGIIARVTLQVPGAFADLDGGQSPPVPPIIPSDDSPDADVSATS